MKFLRKRINQQNESPHIHHLEQQIAELNRKMNVLCEENSRLKHKIKAISEIHKSLQETVDTYQDMYGEVRTVNDSNTQGLKETDEDYSFFVYAQKKNEGNPFNSDQIAAIRYDMKKHLRLIAGAGSGKTQTICAKAAYLHMMKNIPESRIAMITFTNKAAYEMKKRVKEFLDKESTDIEVGTFHSLFNKWLNRKIKPRFPFVQEIGITGDDLKEAQHRYNAFLNNLIERYELRTLDEYGDKTLAERIEYWKSVGYELEDMTQCIKKHFDHLDENNSSPLSHRFQLMYRQLENIRKKENLMIFDDYLRNLYLVLKENKDIQSFLQNQFDYLFIDEFQDTNPFQMKLVQLISDPNTGKGPKLIIVGDDDQSIYFFRGAAPEYIKNFDTIYPTHTVKLMTNYRSIAQVVKAGNRLISNNRHDRYPKSMIPFHQNDGECYIRGLEDQEKEAEWVIQQVQKLALKEKPFKSDEEIEKINYTTSVILYRSSSQLKQLLITLDREDIPFVIQEDNLPTIFQISQFKQVFAFWMKWAETNDPTLKKKAWNNIIRHLTFSHYVKNADLKKHLQQQDESSFNIKKFADFLVHRSREPIERKAIVSYLSSLLSLSQDKKTDLTPMALAMKSFPKMIKEVGKEDLEWIYKVIESNRTLTELKKYKQKMEKRKESMRKKLNDYLNGKFNALYLLTIHRSKGLAFDNVFVIGSYKGGIPHQDAAPLINTDIKTAMEKAEPPTTIEEERRLMYVAITRARKNLYITYPHMINGKPVTQSTFLSECGLPVKNS